MERLYNGERINIQLLLCTNAEIYGLMIFYTSWGVIHQKLYILGASIRAWNSLSADHA